MCQVLNPGLSSARANLWRATFLDTGMPLHIHFVMVQTEGWGEFADTVFRGGRCIHHSHDLSYILTSRGNSARYNPLPSFAFTLHHILKPVSSTLFILNYNDRIFFLKPRVYSILSHLFTRKGNLWGRSKTPFGEAAFIEVTVTACRLLLHCLTSYTISLYSQFKWFILIIVHCKQFLHCFCESKQ